jgi:hypothetical protein
LELATTKFKKMSCQNAVHGRYTSRKNYPLSASSFYVESLKAQRLEMELEIIIKDFVEIRPTLKDKKVQKYYTGTNVYSMLRKFITTYSKQTSQTVTSSDKLTRHLTLSFDKQGKVFNQEIGVLKVY